MTSRIQKIVAEVLENKDLHSSIDTVLAIDEVADKVLKEILHILNNEQGSMNKTADHAKRLADEIKWKMTTDFPHLSL